MLGRIIGVGCLVGGLLGCAVNRPEQSAGPEVGPEVHLFLLAGQSNMAGRGEVTPERRLPITGVMALQQDGSWGPAVDPLHWDKAVAGVGLARSFAEAYREIHPGVTVGFIPAACGGSPVEVWTEGAYFLPSKSYPFDDAVARTRAVMHRGELKAILWHQGEADSQPARVVHYEKRLKDLFAKFRREFGLKNLPIVVGQLGQFEGKVVSEARREVNLIHQRVAAADDFAAFVTAEGLTPKSDMVHFDAASLDEFGRRYAKALAEVQRLHK